MLLQLAKLNSTVAGVYTALIAIKNIVIYHFLFKKKEHPSALFRVVNDTGFTLPYQYHPLWFAAIQLFQQAPLVAGYSEKALL